MGVDEKGTGRAVVKSSMRYRATSAVLAFALWGMWAFMVNSAGGVPEGVVSGVVQGTASFVITLIMISIVTRLYNLMADMPFRLFLPSMVTVGCTGACLVGIHMAAGTPEVMKTVSPPLVVAFLYCLFTTIKLDRSA